MEIYSWDANTMVSGRKQHLINQESSCYLGHCVLSAQLTANRWFIWGRQAFPFFNFPGIEGPEVNEVWSVKTSRDGMPPQTLKQNCPNLLVCVFTPIVLNLPNAPPWAACWHGCCWRHLIGSGRSEPSCTLEGKTWKLTFGFVFRKTNGHVCILKNKQWQH